MFLQTKLCIHMKLLLVFRYQATGIVRQKHINMKHETKQLTETETQKNKHAYQMSVQTSIHRHGTKRSEFSIPDRNLNNWTEVHAIIWYGKRASPLTSVKDPRKSLK